MRCGYCGRGDCSCECLLAYEIRHAHDMTIGRGQPDVPWSTDTWREWDALLASGRLTIGPERSDG